MTVQEESPATGGRTFFAVRSHNLLFPHTRLIFGADSLEQLPTGMLSQLVEAQALVVQQPVAGEQPAPVGTLAMLRPGDGCQLIGIERVRITRGWSGEMMPFVAVAPASDIVGPDAPALADAARSAALAWLDHDPGAGWARQPIASSRDPVLVADVLCQALYATRPERSDLIATDDVGGRLRSCLATLRDMGYGGAADTRNAPSGWSSAPQATSPSPAPPSPARQHVTTPAPAPPRHASLPRELTMPRDPATPRQPAPLRDPAPAQLTHSPPPQHPGTYAASPPEPRLYTQPAQHPGSHTASPPSPRTSSPPPDVWGWKARSSQPPAERTRDTRFREPDPEDAGPVTVRSPSSLRSFADVGGMEKLKEELRRTVGVLVNHPDLVRDLDYEIGGILLHGPPGVGKSFIAEATAGEFSLSFVPVAVDDVVSCWHGESERRLRRIFDTARAHRPCMLFFDEFDAVAARRVEGPSETFDRRILDQLLTLLDQACAERGVIVMAATNDLRALDPAAIREGRFDRQVFIDLPDRAARRHILRAQLERRRVAGQVDIDDLSERTMGLSAAAIKSIVTGAVAFTIEDYVAGRSRAAALTPEVLERALLERRGQESPMIERRTWNDLVLPPATITELRRLVRMIANPDELRRRGLKPVTGALLHGPPGTGKSTIAKVIAAETEGGVNFYPVRAPDIMTSILGSSSSRMRDLFERARQYAPSIIFVDEVDAMLHRRGAGGDDSAGQERDSVIAEFLSQLDGLSARPGVFVLGATNLPGKLDPAVTRSGRLTYQIEIPLPGPDERLDLFRLFTRRMPLAADVDLAVLAETCDGRSGADIEAICTEAGYRTLDGPPGARVTAADMAAAIESCTREPAASPVRAPRGPVTRRPRARSSMSTRSGRGRAAR